MDLSNVQCDSHKDVKKNYSHDERYAPSFRWHSVYGPGHIFGPKSSRYFRSSLGIPCPMELCKVCFKTEKELVRHLRIFHDSTDYVRTPNLIFCRRIDLTKVASTLPKNTEDIVLPPESRTRKSTKSKIKSTQYKPVQPGSSNSESKKMSKAKNTSKPKKGVKQKKSDVLPAGVNPSSSTVAVGANSQVASVSGGSEISVVNPANDSSVPSVVAADSSSDLPALPLFDVVSSASVSEAVVNGLLDYSPGEVSSTTGELESVSLADIARVLGDASPVVCELEEYRNLSLDVKYTKDFIPTNLEECSNVLRQVLVSHYDLTQALYGGFPKINGR